MIEELKQIIEKEKDALKSISAQQERMERINNIIQIKLKIQEFDLNKKSDFYLDLKEFIKSYILSREENKFGYDKLDLTAINNYAGKLELREQVNIYKYLFRLLAINGFEHESNQIETNLKHIEIKYYLTNHPFRNFLKLFYLLSTYNTLAILIIILVIILIGWVLLLPTPHWSITLFNVQMSTYVSNVALNTLLNLINGLLGIDSEFKIVATNLFSSLLLIIAKVFMIIFVINILIKELSNKIIK